MGKVQRAIVLGTDPGAEIVVGGLPLAVRAVLALHAAGFDDVGLVVPGRPRWAAEPLACRRVSVQWVEPATDLSGFGDAFTLLLAGDVLLDSAAVAALRASGPRLDRGRPARRSRVWSCRRVDVFSTS